ncbi:hypothetical protein FACS1894123_09290 [Bacteroidia bacterium]|nr:hypothetical protein AGMMS50276_27870 [Synergistales bacterium]GHU64513.1 hypothetical protein FACS1894123_09290 [Bacteroidia bacterium]
MKKNSITLSDITKKDPFKVPEGYFESLTDSIVSNLPELIPEKTVQISLWNKMKPYIYMAAMFAGIALTIKVFVEISNQSVNTYVSKGLDLRSSTDIDDFYYYYENELAKIVYNDALDDLDEENY